MSSLYRADHVGSFLRPPELLEGRQAQVSLEELEVLENRQISRVLQKQQELGLGVFTDGELRRSKLHE
jgi:5-methyltetrahydropteroyltriglutamate--homocysteine methyltransferase